MVREPELGHCEAEDEEPGGCRGGYKGNSRVGG